MRTNAITGIANGVIITETGVYDDVSIGRATGERQPRLPLKVRLDMV